MIVSISYVTRFVHHCTLCWVFENYELETNAFVFVIKVHTFITSYMYLCTYVLYNRVMEFMWNITIALADTQTISSPDNFFSFFNLYLLRTLNKCLNCSGFQYIIVVKIPSVFLIPSFHFTTTSINTLNGWIKLQFSKSS